MHPDLPLARELQERDHRINELKREISYLPKHIAEIESRLESHRRKLEADRAALVVNQKERRKFEDDIKINEEKMARLRDQMHEAKTNEVYRAFQHEIDFQQSEIRKLEDRILDRMGEAETLEQNVRTASTALDQEAAEVDKEKRAAELRTDADRRELAEAEDRRGAIARSLDPQTLSVYERNRKHRGGIAISAARDGRCMACNVILRLSFYQKVRANQEISTCEACGRILFYLPPEEAPPGEAPKETEDCSLQSVEPRP